MRRTDSFEKTGPSGTRFTKKELFRYRLLVRIIGMRNCVNRCSDIRGEGATGDRWTFWRIL